jgi:protein SCO1
MEEKSSTAEPGALGVARASRSLHGKFAPLLGAPGAPIKPTSAWTIAILFCSGLMALALAFILWLAITPRFVAHSPDPGWWTQSALERPRISGDLVAFHQDGETVRLSDLRGKVWVVTGFFAVCPLCARSNSTDLKTLSETFKDHPDFHLVCISIDPEEDDVEKLSSYAQALGADVKNWWFLTGRPVEIHRYLEKDLKFAPAVERTDPNQIATLGRFQHDLGIMVIDREMRIVGKRNLSWAAGQSPELHAQWQQHLHATIESELSGKKARTP